MANPLLSRFGLGAPEQSQTQAQPNNDLMANFGMVNSLYKMVKGSNNPNEALNALAKNDPNVANTLDFIKKNGGDMNKIANSLAQEAGLSLSGLLGLFK